MMIISLKEKRKPKTIIVQNRKFFVRPNKLLHQSLVKTSDPTKKTTTPKIAKKKWKVSLN